MSRPFKCRHIGCEPGINYFKPRGIPLCALQEVVMTVDEFEAIRLADLEGFYQEDAAKKMKISPKFCQVFEDGDLGLLGAKQAGMIATDVRPYISE